MLDSDGSYGAEGGGGRIETHLEKSHKLLKSDKEVGRELTRIMWQQWSLCAWAYDA